MTAQIILHDYWRSSSSYRVRIGLNLLDLAYARLPVDLVAGDQREPAHLALHPQGLVPVLEIDGLRLTQSLAILDYLEETRDAGFLPKDAPGRARVRALAHAIAMEIQPVCNLRVAQHQTGPLDSWMRHFIHQGLTGFEASLTPDSAFCHGDRPGLAEICLVPQVYNARRWEVDLAPFPRLAAIAQRAESLPAFAAAHPDRCKP